MPRMTPPKTRPQHEPALFWLIYEDCIPLGNGLMQEITLEHPRPQRQDTPDPVLQ